MPTIEELTTKVEELETNLEERNDEILDIKKDLEDNSRLTKNHEHLGAETKRLEDLIKRLSYVDAKEFRALGTAGITQVITIVTATDPARTHVLTFKKGILTTYSLT